jgi:hypothetical protein
MALSQKFEGKMRVSESAIEMAELSECGVQLLHVLSHDGWPESKGVLG